MALLSDFAASGTLVASLPKVAIYPIPSGWIVYYPPEVLAEYSGDGTLETGIFAIVNAQALHTGGGTLSSVVFAIAKAAANFTGSGSASATVSLTNASVQALFSGDGTADAVTVYQYGRTADFTGSGDFTATAVETYQVLADFASVGNLNPEGLVEIEFTPLNLSGSGDATATVVEIETLSPQFWGDGDLTATSLHAATAGVADFTGSGTADAIVAAVTFSPLRMTKNTSQSIPNSTTAKITGWNPDSTSPHTTTTANIVNNELVVNGDGTISVSMTLNRSTTNSSDQAYIYKNGVQVAASDVNNFNSTRTATWSGTVVQGDTLAAYYKNTSGFNTATVTGGSLGYTIV
ncbi:hypothetical protein QT969_10365 [Rhodococcus sp. CSLK01-03]|uniref:Uncharacterized protein n=1 Tax=Rhodococcus indonesiensis TaxID=3055869 RepID=A0ABT7RM28_9NOCA|nr:hypothetical protein [Rhodococcus indonesiensis]MDM7488694.1 hypothetical protein [Rhodococcus indonesiensis]